MNVLNHKVDFILLASVSHANPNGDPLNGNRPRTEYSGLGEISDVCVKRKLRNRMQDLGHRVFVQSDDRCDDGFDTLRERADAVLGKPNAKELRGRTGKDDYAKRACAEWIDVRSFGQVFPFKGDDKEGGVSVGVRGPVSIHPAFSVSPVEVDSLQITKSVNADPADERGSNRMGAKHMVNYGLYLVKGAVNVQLARKTGFSEEDAQVLKECLRTLFLNDASAARPEGSMEVFRLYWWEHNCPIGQYSSGRVHSSLKVTPREGVSVPASPADYLFELEPLPGLKPEILDGI